MCVTATRSILNVEGELFNWFRRAKPLGQRILDKRAIVEWDCHEYVRYTSSPPVAQNTNFALSS